MKRLPSNDIRPVPIAKNRPQQNEDAPMGLTCHAATTQPTFLHTANRSKPIEKQIAELMAVITKSAEHSQRKR
jgi:hypothetical protein